MNNNIFDEIRRQVDIVDIISHYISITKHGKDYVGLCPFHSDNNPSLHVSPEKQIYKCFSCGAAGNVFTFVQNYEKINAVQALKRVCELANLPIPEQFKQDVQFKEVDVNERYHNLMKDLSNYYNLQLRVEEGQNALKYLQSRNITNEDIAYFKIGYCSDDGTKSIEYLKSKGYKDDEIHTCGVIPPNSKEMLDQQRGRVIFPILDSKGRVVAFSGRRLKDDGTSKYVNTTDTIIFHKSNVLYNYSNISMNTRKEGYCYIVEGFMDAIALHKSGIKCVVASMGTAFTDEHKKLLNDLKCEIRLFFDSDEPGQNTTLKSLKALLDQKFSLKVVKPMIDTKDIDEVLKTYGKERVIEIANNLQNPVEYQLDFYGKRTNFNNHESTKEYIKNSLETLSKAHLDDIDLDVYLNRIANESHIGINTIRHEFEKNNTKKDYEDIYFSYPEPVNIEKHLDRYEQADHQILKMMIDSQLNIVLFKSSNISLCSKTSRQLAALIIDTYSKGEDINYASLYDKASGEVAKLITKLSEETYPEAKLEDLIKIVSKDYLVKVDLEELNRKLKEATSLEEKLKIGQQIIEMKKRM